MKGIKVLGVSAVVFAAALSGCATNDQGALVIDPNKVNEIISNALTPQQPQPVAVVAPAPVVVEEEYAPVPTDAYVAMAADRDVVIVGGDTYVWVVGSNGRRERHFYAHGDRRDDVFRRREELHTVMAHHDGHLPDHAIGGGHGPEMAHGGPLAHGAPPAPGQVGAHGAAMAGGQPQAHVAGTVQPNHPMAAAKPAPAPAKPATKDPKKT